MDDAVCAAFLTKPCSAVARSALCSGFSMHNHKTLDIHAHKPLLPPCCISPCCLQALRSHKEALLTVVEVVLHDPMYKWQMTPVKAQRRQQDPIAADGGGAAAATPAGPAAGAASSGAASSAGGPAGSGAAAIGNADAERAVLRVKQKLEGQDVEGGVAMSVAAQVGKWLQSAQDPDRLCRMFVGWAAWQ